MSVERCPSCGRTWDGLLCFACGHERGKAVRGAPAPAVVTTTNAPSPPPPAPLPRPPTLVPPSPSLPLTATLPAAPVLPTPSMANPFSGPSTAAPGPPPARPAPAAIPPATFARSGTPGPQFAPLPPLPPLGRAPTGTTLPAIGAPSAGPLPPPPSSMSPALAPPLGSAPHARSDTAPAPFPGFLRNEQQGLQPSPVTGVTFARDTSPAVPAPPLPPLPPVQPRAVPQAAPRPRPALATPAAPVPPSTPAALFEEDHTAESELPSAEAEGPAWLEALRRLYRTPFIFAIVFAAGFVLTFGPGALLVLRRPSADALLQQRRYSEVIDLLKDKRDAGRMDPGDWLVYGHALERQYGPLQWDQMLDMYKQAAQAKIVDATALENTVRALGDKDLQKKAVAVLAVWPDSSDPRTDPTSRLAGRAADDSFFIRHGVVAALKVRNAPPEILDDAVAASALADLKAKTCENLATKSGLADLERLITGKSRVAVSRHDPYNALLDLEGAAASSAACVDNKAVTQVMHDYAALMGPH